MNIRKLRKLHLAVFGLTLCMASSAVQAGQSFTLLNYVPDDVFVCEAARHNPSRQFIDDYWNDVFAALDESGVASDAFGFISSLLGEGEQAELDRFKSLATELIAAVDWDSLCGKEFVFAQRWNEVKTSGGNINVGPPAMVWMFQGDAQGSAKNYDGLVAILRAMASEINKAAGKEVLVITDGTQKGAKTATLSVPEMPPAAPEITLTIAQKSDIIFISAFGSGMLDQVLSLQAGSGGAKAISKKERFKTALSGLPAPQDNISYFDMQAMLEPIRGIVTAVNAAQSAEFEDKITNRNTSQEANDLNNQALAAYKEKDYAKALDLIKKAHEESPVDSLIIYNLACFHALNGHKDEALKWLTNAVEAGFYAPNQIAKDEDLASLRSDERFAAALAKAQAEAPKKDGKGIPKIATEMLDAAGLFDYIAAVGYTKGHTTHADSVVALTANAAAHPLYKVFGTRKPMGHFDRFLPEETISFSINSSVNLDELYKYAKTLVASVGSEGKEALSKWAEIQQQIGFDLERDLLSWLDGESTAVSMKTESGDAQVFMIRVKDEDAAKEKVNTAVTAAQGALSQLMAAQAGNPMLGMFGFTVTPSTHERLSGFHSILPAMSPGTEFVVGVAAFHVIVGTSPEAVAMCLDTAAKKHSSITSNERLMAEAVVPSGSFHSISFEDKRNFGKDMGDLIGGVAMAAPMAMMMVPDPKVQQLLNKCAGILAKLGPVVRKIDFYKSNASYTVFDGKQWLTKSVTNYREPTKHASAKAPH